MKTDSLTDDEIKAAVINNRSLLSHIDASAQEVLKLRLGIGYDVAYTLDECRKILKMPKEQVRQVEARAMRVLRPIIDADDTQPEPDTDSIDRLAENVAALTDAVQSLAGQLQWLANNVNDLLGDRWQQSDLRSGRTPVK